MKKHPVILAVLLLVMAASGLAWASKAYAKPDDGKNLYVTIYGARIHYIERGEGPTVILIHGLGDNTDIWQATLEALATKYRVIAYDQLGFGKSDKPFISYRIGTMVDFLDGFMKALHIEHASLVGNSMGGWVAVDFALRYPEKVDRLALISAAGYASWPSPDVANALRLATRADFRKLNMLAFSDGEAFSSDAVIDEMFAQHIAANDNHAIQQLLDSAARREDVVDDTVKKIAQPALIVWGRADRLVPLSYGARFHKDIRNSELHIIENCGHMPQVECPNALNPKLLQFLEPVRLQ